MTPTLENLGLRQLSIEDRLALAEQLWNSVVEDVDQQTLTPTEEAELERRIALTDANPNRGVSWEVIRAEAKSRWKR
jgi:putative addiction module component (TIGR02574 family)